jgi:very-short-patch-repair endonuclease
MDVLTALEQRDGVATWTEMELAGVPPGALARALEAGVVARAHRGVYVLPDSYPPFAAAKRLGGHVSHQSAAKFHHLDLLEDPVRHEITVPRARRKKRQPGIEIHRRNLSATDVDGRWPVTSVLRTCMDCFRTLPLREALAVGDSAIRSGRATLDQLQGEAARLRGTDSLAARTAAGLLDERAESVLESVARAEMHLAGLPAPESQVVVQTPLGPRRLDFLFRDQGVGVETDGFATHGQRASLLADCVRHNGYVLTTGLVVLRFGWEHVVVTPDLFTDTVELALSLAAKGWVPQCRRCGGLHFGAAA